MLRSPRLAGLCLAALLALAPQLSAAPAAPAPKPPSGADIPIEDFFVDAEIRSVQVAPDGRHLAFLARLGTGRTGVALMDLETGKIEPLVAAKDENYSWYFWKGSDRIVFGGDIGGREQQSFRSISLSKRAVVNLAEAYQEVVAERANWASLLDDLKFDDNNILIVGNKDAGSGTRSVYRLNIVTGDRTNVPGSGDVGVFGPLADNAGVIRARARISGETEYHEVRADGHSTFAKVAETPRSLLGYTAKWEPLVFAADNRTLYVILRDGPEVRLRAFDTVEKTYLPEPNYVLEGDYDTLVLSWDRSKLLGVYSVADRPVVHWFDHARAVLQAKIDAALPGNVNRIVSVSRDEKVYIVSSSSDRDPGTYFILDLNNIARGRPPIMQVPAGRRNSRISPAQMQPMQPVSYKARDGLVIHGYLTLPAGAAGKRVPLVVHPHGGPYGIRDDWGFDPEVQFMASRGYAVLQPNYRGSGGYGIDFLVAGKREWGGKMQDDLSDGVKWAIDQGIADPERVAIVGASYGGYAALAGVTFTPELYCCAVNYVGVSDLSIISGYARNNFGERDFEHEWIGDDQKYMHDRSPVNFVQNIRVPTLHAYGENDPRVDIDHWRRLKARLDEFHKTYEFIKEGEEGHGFRHEDTRIAFYRQVDQFLAKYLAPKGQVKFGTPTTELAPKGAH